MRAKVLLMFLLKQLTNNVKGGLVTGQGTCSLSDNLAETGLLAYDASFIYRKVPANKLLFGGTVFTQIRCYLPELFRQIRCYLPEPGKKVPAKHLTDKTMVCF